MRMVLFSISLSKSQSLSFLSVMVCSRFTHLQEIDEEAMASDAVLQTSVFISRQSGSRPRETHALLQPWHETAPTWAWHSAAAFLVSCKVPKLLV